MEKKLYEISGKEAGNVSLNDEIFGSEVKHHLIYEKIKNELANQRLGTASTKTRGNVQGGGRKPFKQKGTGRARQGSIRAPQWVGGGVAFGPLPRDYSYQLPKKVRRLAMLTTLKFKIQQDGVVKFVKDFTVDSAKTKDAFKIITALTENKLERTVLVFSKDDEKLKKSLRNIPWLSFMSVNRLEAHELFYAKHIIIMESAVKAFEQNYAEYAKNN